MTAHNPKSNSVPPMALYTVKDFIGVAGQMLVSLLSNPVEPDTLSIQGYENVIRALAFHEQAIQQSQSDPNPLWGILSQNAPYFTRLEYDLLFEMAETLLNSKSVGDDTL